MEKWTTESNPKVFKIEFFFNTYIDTDRYSKQEIIKNTKKLLKKNVSHDQWFPKAGKILKKRVSLVTKKYEAHKNMLSGLKSWNIFSEDREAQALAFDELSKEATKQWWAIH